MPKIRSSYAINRKIKGRYAINIKIKMPICHTTEKTLHGLKYGILIIIYAAVGLFGARKDLS